MLDAGVIQSRSFRNISQGGRITGFQVRIRTPYYRGIWASLLEGADVIVDGEKFGRETIRWTFGNRTFTLPELEAATDVRWPFEESAVLTVPKPGGLAVGMHDVSVEVALRASYFPPAMGPWITRAERKMPLVQ